MQPRRYYIRTKKCLAIDPVVPVIYPPIDVPVSLLFNTVWTVQPTLFSRRLFYSEISGQNGWSIKETDDNLVSISDVNITEYK